MSLLVCSAGTGRDEGDRHPKVGNNVRLGAYARVLGNITVGHCAEVATGALVNRPVQPHTVVAGTPAAKVKELPGEQW